MSFGTPVYHQISTGTGIATGTWNTWYDDAVYSRLTPTIYSKPVGSSLTLPPIPGTWIQENVPGSRRRQIIEVVVGSHVVCEGVRHSIIKWKNLGRYVEVQELKGFDKISYDALKMP